MKTRSTFVSRAAIAVFVLLTALLLAVPAVAAVVARPHADYRIGGTPAYSQSTCGGAPCHTYTKSRFLSSDLSGSSSNDFSVFCLACHNAAGEAHEKNVGSASTNAYDA